MNRKDIPRAAIAIVLIALFGYAYLQNPSDQLLVGALITMTGTSVNWWLGSSKGSSDKSDQMERQATGKPNDPLHTVEDETQ